MLFRLPLRGDENYGLFKIRVPPLPTRFTASRSSRGGETLGVFELTSLGRPFSADDASLLQPLLPLLTAPLQRAREPPSSSLGEGPLMMLEILGSMSSQLEVQPLMRHIRLAAKEVLGAEK